MKVDFLFPTPVGFSIIDENIIENSRKELVKIFNNESLLTCNQFGWKTTQDNLQFDDNFKSLTNEILVKSKEYAENVLGIDFEDFEMSGMWSNCHTENSKHTMHQHPNSFFSGVVYIELAQSDNKGKILFTDPRPAKNMFFADFKKTTSMSERNWWYMPSKGLVIFFPSWLEHGTEPSESQYDERRISLSFNFRIKKCNFNTMKIY